MGALFRKVFPGAPKLRKSEMYARQVCMNDHTIAFRVRVERTRNTRNMDLSDADNIQEYYQKRSNGEPQCQHEDIQALAKWIMGNKEKAGGYMQVEENSGSEEMQRKKKEEEEKKKKKKKKKKK